MSNSSSPRKSAVPSGSGAISIRGKTRQENEKAYRSILAKHLLGDIETLIPHYLHVSPTTPGAQAQLTQVALAGDPAVLDALRDLRQINQAYRTSNQRDEPAMYAPLGVIFDKIISTLSSQATRKFWNSADREISPGPRFPVFPERKPDFLVVDRGFEGRTSDMRWHNIHAIVEVKCPESFGPPSSPTMVQVADEARLQLSAHPFRLFSIILIIHGGKFSVVVIDRGGVMYSPPALVYDDDGLTSLFIAVVQQLAHGLTDRQLGLDPSAERQPTAAADEFPTYHIQPRIINDGVSVQVGADVGQLVTIGRPIWSSMSLFGRGSAVWRTSTGSGGMLVVKTAWRNRDRPQESSIYKHLRELNIAGLPGIAAFVAGGDVILDAEEQSVVSVNALRPQAVAVQIPQDITLHRVLLASIGKPLWEWNNEKELLLGFRAIVNGIEALEALGITHRDISAGNVLLSVGDPRPGYEGFISDFEFAKIPGALLGVPQEHPGPTMTGTLQYMACEILGALESSGPESTQVVHATHHDLESLIYTLSYATYRYVYKYRNDRTVLPKMTPEERKLFERDFRMFFGCVSVSDIHDARRVMIQRSKDSKNNAQGERIFKHLHRSIGMLCLALLNMLTDQYPGLLASSRSVPEDVVDDPMIAKVSKLVPRLVVLVDKKPPPIYLSCAGVKEAVDAFITTYFPEAATNF